MSWTPPFDDEPTPEQEAAQQERAAIVAYLLRCRDAMIQQAEKAGSKSMARRCREEAEAYANAARMIERGDHLKGGF